MSTMTPPSAASPTTPHAPCASPGPHRPVRMAAALPPRTPERVVIHWPMTGGRIEIELTDRVRAWRVGPRDVREELELPPHTLERESDGEWLHLDAGTAFKATLALHPRRLIYVSSDIAARAGLPGGRLGEPTLAG